MSGPGVLPVGIWRSSNFSFFKEFPLAGGQLSSYLRIRYPDVFAGAISSSSTSFGCPGLGLVGPWL